MPQITLNDAFSLYMRRLEDAGSSQSHIVSVRGRLGRFIASRGALPLANVTASQIHTHFLSLANDGLAVGTLAGHKSTHRAFWNWCQAEGYITHNPADVLRRQEHDYTAIPVTRQPADRDDFQRVVAGILQFAAHRNYEPRDVRDALAVSLAVDSSSRRGEIWKLRRADMERALQRGRPLGERAVYRIAVAGKTGTVIVRFFDESAELARRWLLLMPANAAFLFCSLRDGRRLRSDYMGSAFNRLCEFAGVPVFRYQAVRKRVVMDAIVSSGDQKVGQLLAGHKDARTTAVYYNLVQEEFVDAAAANLATQRRGLPHADGDDLAAQLFNGLLPKSPK